MFPFDEGRARDFAPRAAIRRGVLICAPAAYEAAWGRQELPAFHIRFEEIDEAQRAAHPYYGCALDKFQATYADGPEPGLYVKRAGVRAYQVSEVTLVQSNEGEVSVPAGGWVVRNPTGEVYGMSDAVFTATYVPTPRA